MSFNNVISGPSGQVAFIELSHSASQSTSTGVIAKFDTQRESHTSGVSVDAFGKISLDTSRKYWIQASIDITRGSTTSSWDFAFVDGSGTALDYTDGAFDAQWDYASTTTSRNATFTVTYVSESPVSAIQLKCVSALSGSSLNVGTRIFIIEVE
jgi:hypothetical protein